MRVYPFLFCNNSDLIAKCQNSAEYSGHVKESWFQVATAMLTASIEYVRSETCVQDNYKPKVIPDLITTIHQFSSLLFSIL
jgi:hypothetical protein